MRPFSTGHLRRWTLVLVLVLGASVFLSACGSGPNATTKASVVKSACAQVDAALSDGPDPDSDPVGYAEAQILPLGQIRVNDLALQASIDRLDSAYKKFFETSGAVTSSAVKKALGDVANFCPGVGS